MTISWPSTKKNWKLVRLVAILQEARNRSWSRMNTRRSHGCDRSWREHLVWFRTMKTRLQIRARPWTSSRWTTNSWASTRTARSQKGTTSASRNQFTIKAVTKTTSPTTRFPPSRPLRTTRKVWRPSEASLCQCSSPRDPTDYLLKEMSLLSPLLLWWNTLNPASRITPQMRSNTLKQLSQSRKVVPNSESHPLPSGGQWVGKRKAVFQGVNDQVINRN